MKQLLILCQQEEKKLRQLGEQRTDAQNRVIANRQQNEAVTQMLNEYHQTSCHTTSPLLLQNNANLLSSLKPLQKKLSKQQMLLQQEQQRMDGLWQKQLGRQQGLIWLYEQRKSEQRKAQERLEQKQVDDLSSRYQGRG
ncbi:flagellar FliJ family protein [Shewanella sp. UCD-KL12]|uniref:flagellar FliJ family protein n=1 Tax=Shewanella sp. UCD-KL12 TaxID=1917163 RepID=UPI000970F1D8|nr:flagellar FliJ family protein [Shewanella sp. UCD-KL12]